MRQLSINLSKIKPEKAQAATEKAPA